MSFYDRYIQQCPIKMCFTTFCIVLDSEKRAQKSFFNISLMHVLCKIGMKWSTNTLVTKICWRGTYILSQRHQVLISFRHSATTMRGFHVWLSYPYNVQKEVYLKKVWKGLWIRDGLGRCDQEFFKKRTAVFEGGIVWKEEG